jgi:hypothetical protein
MRKSTSKTPIQLANGQRLATCKVCEVPFTIAWQEFVRTFHALCDLRVADIVLGLPWLNDKQGNLKFGTKLIFPVMNGTSVENQAVHRRPECLLLLSTKVCKLIRKSRPAKGRTGNFFIVLRKFATSNVRLSPWRGSQPTTT